MLALMTVTRLSALLIQSPISNAGNSLAVSSYSALETFTTQKISESGAKGITARFIFRYCGVVFDISQETFVKLFFMKS